MNNTIYKYFRFNDNLINSLKESYLWFSICDDFNDPFEFKLYTDNNISDSEILEYWELMSKLDGGNLNHIMQGNKNAFIWSYRNFPDKFVEYFLLPFNKRVRDLGICCFTEKPDNLLMWSHYSDSHKGIVIEFDKEKIDKSIVELNNGVSMTVIDNVSYSHSCPVIKISGNLKTTSDSIKEVVFTKSEDWKYEVEIRIISNLKGKNYFDSKSIKSIFIGSRFKKDKELFEIISEIGIIDDISIYKMKEKDRHYSLEYEKIKPIPL